MKNWIFRNLALRIICLVISVFFWFLAVAEDVHEIRHSLPLEVSIDDSTRVLASIPPAQVQVVFSGKGIDLLKLSRSEAKVVLRIGKMDDPDELVQFSIDPSMVELPENLPIQSVAIQSPKEIELSIDHVITRSVEVYSVVEIKPADGFIQVGEPGLKPRRVRIRGGSMEVMQIDSLPTASETIGGVAGDFSRAVTLDLSGFRTITAVSPESVIVTGRVEVIKERIFEQVPVVLRGGASEQYTLEPKAIDLILGVAQSEFDKLNVEKIKAYVNADEQPNEDAAYEVLVELPKYTVLISKSPEQCRLIPLARAESKLIYPNPRALEFN